MGLQKKAKNNSYSGINRLSCDKTMEGVKKDNPDSLIIMTIKEGAKAKPPERHYKGILVVSPGRDYHFARQDNRMLRVYSKLFKKLKKKKMVIENISNEKLVFLLLKYSKDVIPEIYKLIPSEIESQQRKLMILYKNSKTWSHKPGSTAVTDKDADGKLIFNPLKANWDFSNKGGINYHKTCCFFMIPQNSFKPTYSAGIPSIPFMSSAPKMRTRTNLSQTQRQQNLDKRVRKILKL